MPTWPVEEKNLKKVETHAKAFASFGRSKTPYIYLYLYIHIYTYMSVNKLMTRFKIGFILTNNFIFSYN